MRDLFFFETMITPKIITLVYWLMLLTSVVTGFATMFGGYDGLTFIKFLTGIAIMIGGSVSARVYCELIIVLFKINEHTKKMADK